MNGQNQGTVNPTLCAAQLATMKPPQPAVIFSDTEPLLPTSELQRDMEIPCSSTTTATVESTSSLSNTTTITTLATSSSEATSPCCSTTAPPAYERPGSPPPYHVAVCMPPTEEFVKVEDYKIDDSVKRTL